MEKSIHTFRNSVRVYESHLLPSQKERYLKNNVHEEDEEEIFVDIVKNLSPGDVFVNVGTAIGYYPILSKKIRKDIDVHCFEPLIRHLDYFLANMELNGLSSQEFFTHQVAISTENGEVLFKDNSYGSSLLAETKGFNFLTSLRAIKDSFNKSNHARLYVRSIRLFEIFALINKTRINFLQMDIQGFELPVLEKYFEEITNSPNRIDCFLVGTHSAAIHNSCVALLCRNGYQIVEDIPESLNQPDGIIFCKLI